MWPVIDEDMLFDAMNRVPRFSPSETEEHRQVFERDDQRIHDFPLVKACLQDLNCDSVSLHWILSDRLREKTASKSHMSESNMMRWNMGSRGDLVVRWRV